MNTNMFDLASAATDDRLPNEARTPVFASRDIPNAVERGSWRRDDGRCAFVSKDGVRCKERSFLEFHHVKAHALGGPPSLENISLRCRRHNRYEAELIFGPRTRRPFARQ